MRSQKRITAITGPSLCTTGTCTVNLIISRIPPFELPITDVKVTTLTLRNLESPNKNG